MIRLGVAVGWLAVPALALALALFAPRSPRANPAAPAPWSVPAIEALPDDAWGRSVRHGRDLVAHTGALIGPQAADPGRRFSGNGLDCQSCHIDGGTRKFGLPLVGADALYPSYRARSGKVGTIEERVNGCLMRSMNGRAMPPGSAEMAAIAAYLKFLSGGRPAGSRTYGQGPGPLPELTRAADPVRGASVFAEQCSACHGAQGQGQKDPGAQSGYVVPPLWGPDSFNDGAGLARLSLAARFIRNNMPNGATWAQPALSASDAWDVAAFVEAQPRPHMAGLAHDYPRLIEKPVDAPYGPYADNFPISQHRYGPFGPIRAAINVMKTAPIPITAVPPPPR